jgi:tripartite-type tricarboxylate transporter receptor subunit TctC
MADMGNAPRSLRMLLLVVGLSFPLGAYSAIAQPQQEAAQNYPVKPIRLIVPWVAGGGTDIVARIIALKLSENLGQQIVIDNRPGANGIIGAEIAAKSPPDGYTMVLHAVEHFINASVYSRLPYDTVNDIAPVTLVATHYLVLIVSPTSPAKSVSELVALAGSKPGEFTFGSWGDGSLAHLSGELLKTMAKVDMTHVPYKGAPQAATDVMAGRITFMFTTMPTGLPFIKAGKLLATAVTSTKRVSFLPEVPTMIESGYPGFEVESWRGLFVPARTPKEVINTLHDQVDKVVQLQDIRERIMSAGFEAVTCTPAQLGAFSKAELAKWAKVTQEAGIRIK